MFYVVQLDSDIFKEKIVVPSIWLDKYDTLCLLPPVTDVAEVETLAKAQSMPKHGWQLHSVSFKQSFGTYSQAKENITKSKMIKLEEEEEQHHKEVRGKRKRKLLRFLEQYLIESDDDEEEGCGSTQDDCFMVDNVVLDPLIVKIEKMKDSNEPESHQQPRLNTTLNKNSSSVLSSVQHDNQKQVAQSSSSTVRFCIVKFPSENYVTIVPSGWVKEEGAAKVCAWPPYRSLTRLEKAVKNHEAPKSSWQWFRVDVMKKTDTYEKGLEYEEEAMYRSNLNTECEDTRTDKKKKSHKRKKIISQKNQYSSEGEVLNSSLHPFPSLKKSRNQKTALNITSSLQQAEYLPQNNQPTAGHSSRQLVFRTSEISSPTTPNLLQNLSSFQSSPVLNNILADATLVCDKEEIADFPKKVIRMLESLRSDLKDIMDTLKIKNCHPLPQLPPGCPKFPCENPEDLAELENILQDEGIFNSICNYLSTIGGSCVKDSTKRVLQHLMSNTLSLKYNWKGTRGIKLGFATFTWTTKLILGAVRKNPSSASATEVEVNNIIKTWLMHAKDRDGGRNARAIISNGCD